MAEPVTVFAGGMRWLVDSRWQSLLLGAQGLPIDGWLERGLAQIVKHGPHRTVYRVCLPGLDCHVKCNRLMNARAWCRELIRPAKARIEYDRAREVAARGIATIEPLAVGERPIWTGPGASFLITRSLEGAIPLDALVEQSSLSGAPTQHARLRQLVACELGAFMARVHQAGIVHHDLHAGNLLVRWDEAGRPLFYLIDLHAVCLSRPLSLEVGKANLVLLNRWLTLHSNRSDRRRFWESYLRSWPSTVSGSAAGVAAAKLEEDTWGSNLTFWHHRDARCLATNRYYRRVRGPGATGIAVTDLDQSGLSMLLTDPDAPFRQAGARLLKDSPSSTVAEVDINVGGHLRQAIYKRFRVTRTSDPWVALVRRPPALRSWLFGHGLRERGLPTPRPLLVLHRRRHGLLQEGYLLTEKVVDTVDLRVDLQRICQQPAERRRSEIRQMTAAVARLVRELHRRQLSHRDLKAANILVQDHSSLSRGQPSGGPRVTIGDFGPLWLIDLVGVRLHGRLPRRRRVQNLARIHASFCRHPHLTRTDKLRFLRIYLEWGLHGREGWKGWWQQIEAATADKAARNLRVGRPLS